MHSHSWSHARISGTVIGLGMVATLLSAQLAAAAGPIEWQSGPVSIAAASKAELAAQLSDLATRGAGKTQRIVVQFEGPLADDARAALAQSGVRLLKYVGSNAFFAALEPGRFDAAQAATTPGLVGASEIRTEWKLDRYLGTDRAMPWAVAGQLPDGTPLVGAYVLFHPDVDLLAEGLVVAQQHGADVRDFIHSLNGLVIELTVESAKALAAAPEVQWLETALPQYSETNAENRALTQANLVQAAPYDLNGAGVKVLIYDGGTARADHVDFQGRLTTHDNSGTATHATHVSGTVGGAGVAVANNRGMAPGVTLVSYGFQYSGGGTFLYSNPGDLESDYNAAINTHGVHISNNSIGTNTESNGFDCNIQGDYGVTSALIDAIVRGSLGQPFRVVWAAGNERQGSRCDIEGYGKYYSTAPPAGGKNQVSVGAVNANNDSMTSFSSWGPVDDGRLKPDLVAPGCQSGGDNGVTSCSSTSATSYTSSCGTSMASPTVCGLAALMLQDFRAQFPGLTDFRNSTLKILLAHTAVDRGNPGPDYQFGYGSVRVKEAIDFMRTAQFDEGIASQGSSYLRTVTVAPGTAQLKWTLAWDDAPAAANANPVLVNDLDLRVIAPGGQQHYPWTLNPLNPSAAAVRVQRDGLNNIEQVVVDNPVAGEWTVEVVGFNVPEGPQPFSIAGPGITLLQAGLQVNVTSPVPSLVLPGTPLTVDVSIQAFNQSIVPGTPRIYYRYDGGAFQSQPLTPVSGNLYTASLRGPTCQEVRDFYVAAEGTATGVLTAPAGAPTYFYSTQAGEYVIAYFDDFETDRGWTVQNSTSPALTDGPWERAIPNTTCNRGQPTADFDPTGAGYCYVTDNQLTGSDPCNNDVDGGYTWLISPTIDLSDGDAEISYALWYTNNFGAAPNADVFNTYVSNNNGATWVVCGTFGPVTASGWSVKTFRVGEFVAPTAQVRVRFEASDLGSGSVVEAGIDTFTVRRFQCIDAPAGCPGDMNCDGSVDFDDIDLFVEALGYAGGAGWPYPECPWTNGDANGNGDVTFDDIDPFVALIGTACP